MTVSSSQRSSRSRWKPTLSRSSRYCTRAAPGNGHAVAAGQPRLRGDERRVALASGGWWPIIRGSGTYFSYRNTLPCSHVAVGQQLVVHGVGVGDQPPHDVHPRRGVELDPLDDRRLRQPPLLDLGHGHGINPNEAVSQPGSVPAGVRTRRDRAHRIGEAIADGDHDRRRGHRRAARRRRRQRREQRVARRRRRRRGDPARRRTGAAAGAPRARRPHRLAADRPGGVDRRRHDARPLGDPRRRPGALAAARTAPTCSPRATARRCASPTSSAPRRSPSPRCRPASTAGRSTTPPTSPCGPLRPHRPTSTDVRFVLFNDEALAQFRRAHDELGSMTAPPDAHRAARRRRRPAPHRDADVDALYAAVEENRDHLRPHMPWADEGRHEFVAFVTDAIAQWERGADRNYAIVDAATDGTSAAAACTTASGPTGARSATGSRADATGRGIVDRGRPRPHRRGAARSTASAASRSTATRRTCAARRSPGGSATGSTASRSTASRRRATSVGR